MITRRELLDYIELFEDFGANNADNGEVDVILLWSAVCAHCHAQFRYFLRKPTRGQHDGLGMDLVEYRKFIDILENVGDRNKAFEQYKEQGGTLNKTIIYNIESIAARILPIEITSEMGQALVQESEDFIDKLRSLPQNKRMSMGIIPANHAIDATPTWIDFYTHEKYSTGHHVHKQLTSDILDRNKLKTRRNTFKLQYSNLLEEDCDALACGLPSQLKKIDTKKTKGRV